MTDLFARLKSAAEGDWRAYTEHRFVASLADGTLPEACFRHYLEQDYRFLVHFARAYALAAYKAETLAEIRHAARGLAAVVDEEMRLHVEFCAGWGIGEAALEAVAEAPATLAYTRYVLERGLAGDLLDLHVALAPCMIGYAEIGARLLAAPETRREGNRYLPWIEMYGGEAFQGLAAEERAVIDGLMSARGGEGRIPSLERTFREATRLEIAFWDMGMAPTS